MPWNKQTLESVPEIFDDPGRSTRDVKAFFYGGLPWKGRPTRVFAYYGRRMRV